MDEEATRVAPASPVTKSRGDDKRRSYESPRSLTSSGKLVPHSLRVSTGSCHEFCKHGKPDKHANEAKDSRPWRKPVTRNNCDTLRTKESGVTDVIKKTVVVKPKPSADLKDQEISMASKNIDVHTEQATSDSKTSNASDGPDTTPMSEERVKQEISMASESVIVTAEEALLDTKDLNVPKKSSTLSKVKPSLRSASPIYLGSRTGGSIDGRKSLDGRKSFEGRKNIDGRKSIVEGSKPIDKKKGLDESISTVPEATQKYSEGSMSAVEMKTIERGKTFPEKKGSERSKNLSLESNKIDGGLEDAKINGKPELLKKHVAAPKPKILKIKPLPSLNPIAVKPPSPLHRPASGIRSKTSDDNQVAEKLSSSQLEEKKIGTTTGISPFSRPSVNGEEVTNMKKVRVVRVVSSVRRPRKITKVVAKDPNDHRLQEDTVDAIKIAPEKKSVTSAKSNAARSSSFPLVPPSVSKSIIRSRISYVPSRVKNLPSESEQKTTAKDASTAGLRKSKGVGLKSEYQTTLEARTGTLAGENAQINRRRSLKKRVGPGGNGIEKNNSDSFLLLRRPRARRKKNVQVLFNKVIEETASRLVRTSKSKVLALIGAFETVISIQKKSSAGTLPRAKKPSSSLK